MTPAEKEAVERVNAAIEQELTYYFPDEPLDGVLVRDVPLDALRLLLAMVERDQWQDISTAPKDGPVVLFNDETGEQAVCTHMTAIEDGDEAWIMARGYNDLGLMISFAFRNPTHWRPLPQPPEAR